MISDAQLLRRYAAVMDDLVARGIVRTGNNPASDYAEWLFAKAFKATLSRSSNAGFDATDKRGQRYQVKSRRAGRDGLSTQLGVIRDEELKKFDRLIVVFFEHDFTVRAAYLAPHRLVKKYGRYSKHQRGHILTWRGPITGDAAVEDVTKRVRGAATTSASAKLSGRRHEGRTR